MDEVRQMGKKYIDEKLAKARRTYIEDMINQKEDKGVWKGKVYSLVPYMVGRLDFRVKVPDFLLQALQESCLLRGFPVCLYGVRERHGIYYILCEGKNKTI